jgi:hypothetical protein
MTMPVVVFQMMRGKLPPGLDKATG